jgi:hypothetical protein
MNIPVFCPQNSTDSLSNINRNCLKCVFKKQFKAVLLRIKFQETYLGEI